MQKDAAYLYFGHEFTQGQLSTFLGTPAELALPLRFSLAVMITAQATKTLYPNPASAPGPAERRLVNQEHFSFVKLKGSYRRVA